VRSGYDPDVRSNRSLPILAIATLLACGPNQAPNTPTADAPDGCQVLLSLVAWRGRERATGVTLQASAQNLTDAPLQLTIEDHCPNGKALFSGLAPEYDYYGTCTMGMCMREPKKVITLEPGLIVVIASTNIHPEGEGCNGPIAPGTHELSFSLALLAGANNPVLCGPEPVPLPR
jgi:hypothetical protein